MDTEIEIVYLKKLFVLYISATKKTILMTFVTKFKIIIQHLFQFLKLLMSSTSSFIVSSKWLHFNTVLYSTVECSAVQCNTVQYSNDDYQHKYVRVAIRIFYLLRTSNVHLNNLSFLFGSKMRIAWSGIEGSIEASH